MFSKPFFTTFFGSSLLFFIMFTVTGMTTAAIIQSIFVITGGVGLLYHFYKERKELKEYSSRKEPPAKYVL